MGCPPVRGDNPRALAQRLSVSYNGPGLGHLCHTDKCIPASGRDVIDSASLTYFT